VAKTGSRVTEKLSGTAATLRMLRRDARELFERYAEALSSAPEGLARTVLKKAQDRTVVQRQTLTAHIAKLSGEVEEAAILGRALSEYFAGPEAKVCFRCHFDRPGARPPLERTDPHPYTYICAGCHDDVIAEVRPDLAAQMSRWTPRAQEARAIQHALGRPSRLMASHTVARQLSGLAETPPVLGAAKTLSAALAGPTPDSAARRGVTRVNGTGADEAAYLAILFDRERVGKNW
jgi:hypothetical protein